MALDLGTGTGQAVLRRARNNRDELVIGIDADAAAIAEASRRAAGSPRRGGLPNAIFLAAGAEGLPGPLVGRVDSLTVALPWGSLLRGVLRPDEPLMQSIARCLSSRGEIEILISAVGRDAVDGQALETPDDAAAFAGRYESAGFLVLEFRLAGESDVARLSAAWARRLGIPARRPAWIFRIRQESRASPAGVAHRAGTDRAARPASRAPSSAG